MSRISRSRLLSAASAFTIAAFTASPVHAQDDDDDAEDASAAQEPIEEIVVTGFRRSLAISVADKMAADKIIDTINAEDIGKSTDQNIAEALRRISGVSINTTDGEGTTISVRGANADQTVVTLNGTPLGSTDFSQGVDLSAYSADILSKIEVVKTPSADDEEGSLGGVVNLITRKPLELTEGIRSVTAQGRYGDLSEDDDHKLSATFSENFFDNRFGVIFTAYDETYTVRRDEYYAENHNVFGSNIYTDQNGNSYGNQAAIDAEAAGSALDGRTDEYAELTPAEPLPRPQWTFGGGHAAYADIVKGIAPSATGNRLNRNRRDRQGIDLTVQFALGGRTDLTLSSNISNQEFDNRMDALSMPVQTWAGHIDGITHPGLFLPPAFNDRSEQYQFNTPELGGNQLDADGNILWGSNRMHRWTDPVQDWRVLDTDTRTWTSWLSRHSAGSTHAAINHFENENSLLALELNHAFTDRFRFTAGGASTASDQKPGANIYMTASRNRTVSPWNMHHVPADILQPAGYDCSSGACRLVGGTTSPHLGNVVDLLPNNNDLWDNIGRTGFNPDDLASHTLTYINSTVTEVSDESSSAFVDFDWDVDFGGISSVEFGAKYTERSKFVDAQSGTPRPSDDLIEAISPFTGNTIFLDPTRINLISAAQFDGGEISAPGFMNDLGVPTNHITDGWTRFDPEAALAAVTQGDRAFTLDSTQTRSADFENAAIYAKTNFEFGAGRVRGDVGLRYVRSTVDTAGFAGAVFATDSFGTVIDPILLHRMRNSDKNNRCPVLSDTPDPNVRGVDSDFHTGETNPLTGEPMQDFTGFQDRNRWARIDGNGWDTQLTQGDFSDDTPIPAVPGGLCYDPLLEPGALPSTFVERNLTRYADISTEQQYVYDRQIGENGNLVSVDRSRASIPSTDTHDYSVVLPSMNLSFAASPETIVRFAASKTMSRPAIDNLRAGFRMTEGSIFEPQPIFRPGSTLRLYGAGLDPLESTNLDVSVEWYFDDSALLAANLFRKNIENLEEERDSRYFLGDLRRIAADPEGATYDGININPDDGNSAPLLLAEAGAGAAPDILQCMPRRLRGETNLANAVEILFSGDPTLLCDEYNVTQFVNAEKAAVNGVELQYTQNYTFLPGAWSGLGATMNYTWQDGQFDGSEFQIPGTPQQAYNATLYWSMGGHQIRLAWSGSSDVLLQRSFRGGASWRKGRDTLDLSADYRVNDSVAIQFNAQNLTDEPVRTFWTSRLLTLPDASGTPVTFDEGSAISGNAPDNRTLEYYNTGVIYRLAVRVEF